MSNIFNLDFGSVTSDAELENLIASNPKLSQAYICIATLTPRTRQKKLIETLWNQYQQYADPKFENIIKLDGEFFSRCWEMFLACTLLAQGHELQKKSSADGPDIKIISHTPNVWVEAVSCTAGTTHDAVPKISYGRVVDKPTNQMILRVSNAITSKHQKYHDYLNAGTIQPTEPYIVAVSMGSIDQPDSNVPIILRYLYGIGDPVLKFPINSRTGKRSGEPISSFAQQFPISKKGGAPVPVGFFEDPSNSGISAVIYCQNNILNHPEPLGADFVLLKNPNASSPISGTFLSVGAEWVVDENRLVYQVKNFINQANAFDFLNEIDQSS